MKATKIKPFLCSTLIFSVLLMFISCSNLFEHNIENDSEPAKTDNKTYLRISYNANNSGRTIFPAQISPEYLTNPVLYGIAEGDSEKKVFDLMASSLIEILPGKWTFTLTAIYEYISEPGADPLSVPFTDTVTVNIVQGQSNTVVFNLKPQGDAGGIKLHLDLSSEANIDSVKVTLKNISGSTIKSDNLDMSDKSDVLFTHTNLKAGTYFIHYDFFTGNDPTPVNQWESYVKILPPFLTEADISMNFNSVYTISYDNGDGTIVSGIEITKYSTRSSFSLPVCKSTNGKIFLGWKRTGDTSPNFLTEITSGSCENLSLSAYYVDPVLYVSDCYMHSDSNPSTEDQTAQDNFINAGGVLGSDDNDGFTSETPLKTINGACAKILEYGDPDFDWTIYVTGKITGISSSTENLYKNIGRSVIPETLTSEYAKSILLTGQRGLDTNKIPKDMIDRGIRGWSSSHKPQDGSTLLIASEVPVTISNLKISGGVSAYPNSSSTPYHNKGGGISISSDATVILADGALITNNSSSTGGGIYNEGNLYVYGTATIGDASKTTYAGGASDSGNDASSGGGLYNTGTACLGYDPDGTAHSLGTDTQKAGIFYNYASVGGAIYNTGTLKINSGNYTYNKVVNSGAGVYNLGTFEFSGGSIENNIGGSNGGGVCNDTQNSTPKRAGTFTFSGGNISKNVAYIETSNNAGKGGGVFNSSTMYMYNSAVIGDSSQTEMASSKADSSNYSSAAGGGLYNSGTLYMGYKNASETEELTGGIYYNLAAGGGYNDTCAEGGGLYNAGTVFMNSGTIANNKAYTGNGNAVVISNDNFTIGGKAKIPAGSDHKQDVYYTATYILKVLDTLSEVSSTDPIYLTPRSSDGKTYWTSGAIIGLASNAAVSSLADVLDNFVVSPLTDSTNGKVTLWTIDATTGKVKQNTESGISGSLDIGTTDLVVRRNGNTIASGTIITNATSDIILQAFAANGKELNSLTLDSIEWYLDDSLLPGPGDSALPEGIKYQYNSIKSLQIDPTKLSSGVHDVRLELKFEGMLYSFTAQIDKN